MTDRRRCRLIAVADSRAAGLRDSRGRWVSDLRPGTAHGIFGGSGVGKSTLMGMMARGTAADMTVLALVGERGREVGEFLEELGEEGRRRSVVVVSTSDQSPLLRIRAALAATAMAEYFARAEKRAARRGLAHPIRDGATRDWISGGRAANGQGIHPFGIYALARLVERAGRFAEGSITAFYTVLMEGDDQQDPVVDAVRSFLDGHVLLDRELATRTLSAHFDSE